MCLAIILKPIAYKEHRQIRDDSVLLGRCRSSRAGRGRPGAAGGGEVDELVSHGALVLLRRRRGGMDDNGKGLARPLCVGGRGEVVEGGHWRIGEEKNKLVGARARDADG